MSLTADGRAQRFATLYAAHYAAVHAYGSRRVGRDAADEIVAETFLIAWRRFDAVPNEPLPWLYGVARNVVLRHQTATSRQRQASDVLSRERVDQRGLVKSEDPQLWAAWSQLRDADREVLALIAWEELSVAEAARALGCSAPVLSVRLHRARRRLERLLAAGANHPAPAATLSEA